MSDAEGGAEVKRARVDSLPEYAQYRDTGCEVHPACLSCPLPVCRYDDPRHARALLSLGRDQEIVRLRRQGLPVDQLAHRYGVSRRTVFRILKRKWEPGNGKEEGLAPTVPFLLPATLISRRARG